MANQVQTIFRRSPSGSRFFSPHQTVVIAVSGGVDSMVLLDLFQSLPVAQRPQLVVAHVNHQLRPESDHEEATLRMLCRDRELPLVVARWPLAAHPAHGVEAAARRFRYSFFARVMKERGAGALATAHHADDLAETFLMKLVRGGQLSELTSPRAARPFGPGTLIRPLLEVTKAALYDYAQKRQLTWFEDATNQDLSLTRNRYRHDYLPTLTRENPRLVTALGDYHQQLVDLLATVAPTLAAQTARLVDKNGELDLTAFSRLTPAEQRTLLRHWLITSGVTPLRERQLVFAWHLLGAAGPTQGTLSLAMGWQLVRTYDRARLKKGPENEPGPALENSNVVKLGRWYYRACGPAYGLWPVTSAPPGRGWLWLTPDQLPLHRRVWQPGDRLALKGGGHQRVSRILIDQKVPRGGRAVQEVVVDNQGQVIWLVGRKTAWLPKRPAAVPVNARLQVGKE